MATVNIEIQTLRNRIKEATNRWEHPDVLHHSSRQQVLGRLEALKMICNFASKSAPNNTITLSVDDIQLLEYNPIQTVTDTTLMG